MKNRVVSLLGLLVILLCSCTGEEPQGVGDQVCKDSKDEYLVSLPRALENADKLFAQILGSTRSVRKVQSITILASEKTRSGEAGNGFYIVNYENEGGFAILSADSRRIPVYAISDVGRFDIRDTTVNPGLANFIDILVSGIPDSLRVVDREVPIVGPEVPWSYYKEYSKPMLSGFMNKFHQRHPYNMYCNSGPPSFLTYLVGCGPLAVGTIMGYFEWPNSWSGFYFPWQSMRENGYHERWARLFETLGRPENLNATYGTQGTGIYMSTVARTFANYGYRRPVLSDLKPGRLESELINGIPVLVAGERGNFAHAWVIDGGFTKGYYQEPVTADDEGRYIYTTYYHCVWGWEGKCNGYYVHYAKYSGGGSIGGDPILDDEAGYPENFYDGMTMVTGYKPEK